MYLISAQYFIREISIPNVNELIDTAGEELDQFIDEGARAVLMNALGTVLFQDLDSQITDGTLDDDADEKWDRLVNGYTYTLSGVQYAWKGLLYTEGTFKSSVLAYYVFHEWLQWQTSMMSGVGEVVVTAKNAVSVSSNQRLVTTWNKFVEMYQGDCISGSRAYYHNNVLVRDFYNASTSVSLIKFLRDNAADYPDANCMTYSVKNQLGL